MKPFCGVPLIVITGHGVDSFKTEILHLYVQIGGQEVHLKAVWLSVASAMSEIWD